MRDFSENFFWHKTEQTPKGLFALKRAQLQFNLTLQIFHHALNRTQMSPFSEMFPNNGIKTIYLQVVYN